MAERKAEYEVVREALAQAWEDGARSGHHSPLTWFALRQCNPHRTADMPHEWGPNLLDMTRAEREAWVRDNPRISPGQGQP